MKDADQEFEWVRPRTTPVIATGARQGKFDTRT
jgi:hypothetical protein